MSRILRPLLLASALGLFGCKGQCRQLSEKLCHCKPTTILRDSCLQEVSVKSGIYTPTAAQEANCEALMKTCDCNLTDTPAGKTACGLAR